MRRPRAASSLQLHSATHPDLQLRCGRSGGPHPRRRPAPPRARLQGPGYLYVGSFSNGTLAASDVNVTCTFNLTAAGDALVAYDSGSLYSALVLAAYDFTMPAQVCVRSRWRATWGGEAPHLVFSSFPRCRVGASWLGCCQRRWGGCGALGQALAGGGATTRLRFAGAVRWGPGPRAQGGVRLARGPALAAIVRAVAPP